MFSFSQKYHHDFFAIPFLIKHSFVPDLGLCFLLLFVLGLVITLSFFPPFLSHSKIYFYTRNQPRNAKKKKNLYFSTGMKFYFQISFPFFLSHISFSENFLNKSNFLIFFPCASNQSWACLPMLSTVPKCKCFTSFPHREKRIQRAKFKSKAFECLMQLSFLNEK